MVNKSCFLYKALLLGTYQGQVSKDGLTLYHLRLTWERYVSHMGGQV